MSDKHPLVVSEICDCGPTSCESRHFKLKESADAATYVAERIAAGVKHARYGCNVRITTRMGPDAAEL